MWKIKPVMGKEESGLSLVAQLVRIRLQSGRPGFDPWNGKIPWRKERLPTPVFWPREFPGLYSPWSTKSWTWLSHFQLEENDVRKGGSCGHHGFGGVISTQPKIPMSSLTFSFPIPVPSPVPILCILKLGKLELQSFSLLSVNFSSPVLLKKVQLFHRVLKDRSRNPTQTQQ